MPIVNGDTIDGFELSMFLDDSLEDISTDAGQRPQGILIPLSFDGITASSDEYLRTKSFITPADLFIEAIAVEASDYTAASTLTVSVTANGGAVFFPIERNGSTGAGRIKLTRLLYDGARSSPTDFETTSRAFRVYPKGTTVAVGVETTSVATGKTMTVTIVGRTPYVR